MGVDFARAAPSADDAVVATGRNPDAVADGIGEADDLLAVKHDVTSPAEAETAVKAAVDLFGRVDVLVNNPGNFYAGFFEEIKTEDFRRQVETTLFGPMNATRAVLPVMRAQHSGLASRSPRQPASWAKNSVQNATSKFGVDGGLQTLSIDGLIPELIGCPLGLPA